MNKLGSGFLRLPKSGEKIDYPLLNQMVDTFLSNGGTYFDTAYTYLDGKSEIAIPDYFAMYNELRRYPGDDWKIQPGYDTLTTRHGKASDCISCKSCERHCPQHLPIADNLAQVAKAFDY